MDSREEEELVEAKVWAISVARSFNDVSFDCLDVALLDKQANAESSRLQCLQ